MKRFGKGILTAILTVAMFLFGAIGCEALPALPDNGNTLSAVEQSSIFASLDDGRLTVQWGAVERATAYLVTYDGTTLLVEAPSTRVVFTGVENVSGSLTITIVARASGLKDSAATTYTFTPSDNPPAPPGPSVLATPTGLAVSGGKLTWMVVPNATSYVVSDGTKAVEVTTNSIDLAANGLTIPTSGSVTYNVVARAMGSADSSAAVFTYTASVQPPQPTTLAMPTGLSVSGGWLMWTSVANATSYVVSDGTTTVTVTTTNVNLADNGFATPSDTTVTYTVTAKASGYNDSPAATCTHTFGHTHTFGAGWTNNETHHWHPVTCGHSLVIENEYAAAYGAHEFGDGNVCSVCGYTRPAPTPEQYVTLGEYPQTLKDDSVTVGNTADANGYYTGSDGAKYAKVTAAPAERFPGDRIVFGNNERIMTGTEYYFKVEPIKWRVLEKSDGSTLLLCDSIIEGRAYYGSQDTREIGGSTVYPSNYMHSDIRAWLNGTFYSVAFSASEQGNIKTTTVDNSAATTSLSTNTYVCENTQDKIFLLSNRDLYNTAYGFISDGTENDPERFLIVSDYARAVGVYARNEAYLPGGGAWWLRSPMHDSAVDVDCGTATGAIGSTKVNKISGIAPAMRVAL